VFRPRAWHPTALVNFVALRALIPGHSGEIAMRGVAQACGFLLFLISLSPAWAEAARTPRGAWTVSDRALKAEERSRAATTSICRGCLDRIGTGEGSRGRPSRPLAANPSRAGRGPSLLLMMRAWTATEALPLTSRAEAQSHGINRSIAFQAQRRQDQQQLQFELNQLRSDLQRAYLFR
jgi:hypothetical protein